MPVGFLRFFLLIAIAIAAMNAMKTHACEIGTQEKTGHEARSFRVTA